MSFRLLRSNFGWKHRCIGKWIKGKLCEPGWEKDEVGEGERNWVIGEPPVENELKVDGKMAVGIHRGIAPKREVFVTGWEQEFDVQPFSLKGNWFSSKVTCQEIYILPVELRHLYPLCHRQ